MKKGLGSQDVIKYFLVMVVTLVIVLFGAAAVNLIQDKTCQTELTNFQIQFRDIGKGLRAGTVKEKEFSMPCEVDRVLFFDTEQSSNPEWFSHEPIIRENLKGKTGKNVFLLEGDTIKSSFSAGDLDIDYPHFMCVEDPGGKISLMLESFGKEVRLTPSCMQTQCTFVQEDFDEENILTVFRQAVGGYGGIRNEFDSLTQVRDIQLYDHVEIRRSYRYCAEEGKTSVDLTFIPEDRKSVQDLRYFESIPAECIDDVDTRSLSAKYWENPKEKFYLIMWPLGNVDTETEIGYEVDLDLGDDCKERIKGAAVAKSIYERSGKPRTGPKEKDEVLEIISTPVLETKQSFLYRYDVNVRGGDDAVFYSLVKSPPGMSINADTGEIRWGSALLGDHIVRVKAEGDDGQLGEQEYQLSVIRDSETLSPCTTINRKSVCDKGDVMVSDDCGTKTLVQRCLAPFPFCKSGRCMRDP